MAKPISVLVSLLCEAFRQTPSQITFMAFEAGLSDMDPVAIETGVMEALKRCKFMPTVAEIRELAGGMKHAERAELAWMAVNKVQKNPYRHMDFDDPITNATIRAMGGWVSFIERFVNQESEKWARKEFLETYQRFMAADVNGEVCRPLPGLSDPPQLMRVKTGLPKLVNAPIVQALPANKTSVPRVEFKKP